MKLFKQLILCLTFLSLFLMESLAKIQNPYKILGIPSNANEEQIKQGFKKRSKKYHPDRNKTDPRAKQKFEKIVNAYQLLKDPERRRIYDMTGDDNPNASQQPQWSNRFNVQDIISNFGGFQQGRSGQRTYTFTFKSGNGMHFNI